MTRPVLSLSLPVVVRTALAACAFGLGVSSPALAQSGQPFPSKPIRLIVPLGAGSSGDIIARLIGAELSKAFGQQVVVDLRPGAGGTIGTTQAARATPDGYTLLLGTNGTLAINVGLYPDLKYDPMKDFIAITNLAAVVNALCVNPTSPAKTVPELIALAKAQPGKLTYSSGGAGTTHHLSGELLKAMTGIDIVHVPFRGAAEAATSVIGGETSMTFLNIPVVIGQIKEGRLRAIGVTSLERSGFLPEVPTLNEQGLKGYLVEAWFGVFAPTGTPPAIVEKLDREMLRILAQPATKELLTKAGFQAVKPSTPPAFQKILQAEIARWVPIVKAAGATAN